MDKSPTISELAKALVRFQMCAKTIGFDAANPFFKSKYATLAALVSETRHDLANCGLSVSQLTEDEGAVTTILMHTSGEYLMSKLALKPVKDDPQGRGSCLTYARRYSYASILGLVADEDDDGNAATHGNGKETKKVEKKDDIQPPAGVKSMKEFMIDMAKTKFDTPDGFKVWRIDNNIPENIEGWKELEYAQVFNKLKALPNGKK